MRTAANVQPVPRAVDIPCRVSVVSLGWDHCVAVSADGRAYSWGKNSFGQLGHGDKAARLAPTLIASLWSGEGDDDDSEGGGGGGGDDDVRAVHVASGWSFSVLVAVRVGGGDDMGEADCVVYSWGAAASGQLGHGDKLRRREPARVAALDGAGVVQVACGENPAAALTAPIAAAGRPFAATRCSAR